MKRLERTKARKANIIFILFLILILSPATGCAPRIPNVNPNPVVATQTATSVQSTEVAPATPTVSNVATADSVAPTIATSNPATTNGSLMLTPEADARVNESKPGQNYGSGRTLQVQGASDPGLQSFLRFTVNGASGNVQRAVLRVFATDNGTNDGPAVYSTDNSWTENEITWGNRPKYTGNPLDNKGSIGTNSWAEYDVTPAITGDGTFSFVLVADSSDSVVFSSRQGSQSPQLVLTFGEGGTSITAPVFTPTTSANIRATSADGVVFVGAGDISECDNNNDNLTAQLLDSIPGTVFTTGDNAYNDGTYDQYMNCYDPTWGQHKDRTKPIPGNHEYRTSRAAGYFQYFNNIPSYYAYNLGSWRIYALNSEIDVSPESPQVVWLKADLAANPTQCVLAYWHRPRWSSGNHHGSDPYYQTLWQTLYQAGAEVVLNGHEHNYERFAPMNATGQPDPAGMREFVIGTGGRDHYDFGSPLPTSEIRNSTAYGVLKLTLRESGYDWEFVPAEGSTFTDSGNADCH